MWQVFRPPLFNKPPQWWRPTHFRFPSVIYLRVKLHTHVDKRAITICFLQLEEATVSSGLMETFLEPAEQAWRKTKLQDCHCFVTRESCAEQNERFWLLRLTIVSGEIVVIAVTVMGCQWRHHWHWLLDGLIVAQWHPRQETYAYKHNKNTQAPSSEAFRIFALCYRRCPPPLRNVRLFMFSSNKCFEQICYCEFLNCIQPLRV